MTIQPTIRFCIVVFVTLAVFMSALNYQKNALYWLTYGLIALILVFTATNVWLKYKTTSYQWATPTWRFSNETPDFSTTPSLPPGWLVGNIDTSKPGYYPAQPIHFYTEYPFGLFRTSIALQPYPATWVYPSPINQDTIEYKDREQNEPSIRQFLQQDRIREVVKKTMTLPQSQWKSKTELRERSAEEHTILDFDTLPSHWSPQQKFEHLSYLIRECSSSFQLRIGHSITDPGQGLEHQHKAWQLLAHQWSSHV